MKETIKQARAFELYYTMSDRSLRRLHELILERKKHRKWTGKVPAVRTLKSWSKAFNWQERVEQRDIENSKKIKEHTNKIIVNSKANYRAEIKQSMLMLNAILNKVFERDIDGKLRVKIEPTKPSDVAKLLSAKEALIRLDMDLQDNPLGAKPVQFIISNEYLPEDKKEDTAKQQQTNTENTDVNNSE